MIKRLKEIALQVKTYKTKSIDKIKYYENNRHEMIQNHKIVAEKATYAVNVIKQIESGQIKLTEINREKIVKNLRLVCG